MDRRRISDGQALKRPHSLGGPAGNRGLAALIAALAATDVHAKDVGGLFIIVFVFGGAIAGLVVGAVSALIDNVRFWRGALWLLPASLLPWAALLLYWNLPFPAKTFIENWPFLVLVLIGSVPAYPIAYAVASVFRRY